MKKAILIALVLIYSFVFALSYAKQGYTTGTTTESYVKVLDLATYEWEDMLFIIKNTGTTNTMYYKVYGYALNDGENYEEFIEETSLGTGSIATIKLSNTAYSNIEIYVKNNSGETTFNIEYALKP